MARKYAITDPSLCRLRAMTRLLVAIEVENAEASDA